ALHEQIHLAPEVGAHNPYQSPERDAYANTDQADIQGDPRPIDEPAQRIAPQLVSTEPEALPGPLEGRPRTGVFMRHMHLIRVKRRDHRGEQGQDYYPQEDGTPYQPQGLL